MSDGFSAKMVIGYSDDGNDINVKMDYADSNGVRTSSSHVADNPDKVSMLIMNDIIKAMKAKKTENKPKRPEDMSKEELLNALKLMESEANEQRTRADLLQKRLKYENKKVDRKNVVVEEPPKKKLKYDNIIEYMFNLLDDEG